MCQLQEAMYSEKPVSHSHLICCKERAALSADSSSDLIYPRSCIFQHCREMQQARVEGERSGAEQHALHGATDVLCKMCRTNNLLVYDTMCGVHRALPKGRRSLAVKTV